MTNDAPPESPLFATTPVVSEPRHSPVIVVGLPRSGSSFLSHVMSQIEDWYVFDDLYLFRTAKGLGVDGSLSEEQLEKLVDFLGWQLRARIKWAVFEPPRCTWADVDEMNAAILTTFRGQSVHWYELLEEWMTRLAVHHGCTHWGYKAPQDFMHLDMLRAIWPGVRFIFVYRDPRRVMASKKYVDGQDGTPGEYHPVVYARYWRMASDAMTRATREGKVHFTKFEKLVADPNEEARKIAEFLGSRFEGEVRRTKGNTSFKGGKRRSITPTEAWICERVAGTSMQALGYERTEGRLRVRDVPDFVWTSGRFALAQTKRLARNPAARQSVWFFLKSLVGRENQRVVESA